VPRPLCAAIVYGRAVPNEGRVDVGEGDPRAALPSAFAMVHAGRELGCDDLRGFGEAIVAARDAGAEPPPRIDVVGPTPETAAWLDAWAEDDINYRRTVTARRQIDGARFVVVATIAAHGYGVDTSLVVESVSPRRTPAALTRSGVHARVNVAMLLALHDAELVD
jgi:hypothetical protein